MSPLWLAIPPTTTITTPIATATTATSSSTAATPRGTRWRASHATAGAHTAATTDAAIRGITIVWVSDRSQTMPTSSTKPPTSSQAVKPTSRSHRGAARESARPDVSRLIAA